MSTNRSIAAITMCPDCDRARIEARRPRRSTRRTLLGCAAGAAVTALLTGCDFARATATPAAKRIGAFGTKVDAGSLAEVHAALAAQPYIRNTDGRFYLLPATNDSAIAVYWKCPVEGCTVPPPNPALGGNLRCPCCGAMYDGIIGAVLRGPTNRPADFVARPLDWMPIGIVGGHVIVDTGSVMPRAAVDPHQATALR